MEAEILKVAGQVAGIGGIAIAAFVVVFRNVIRKNVFPTLTKDQGYRLLRLILILASIVAIVGIAAWIYAVERTGRDVTTLQSGPVKVADHSANESTPNQRSPTGVDAQSGIGRAGTIQLVSEVRGTLPQTETLNSTRTMSDSKKPRIWITYAWSDNEEGNFSYLVQELNKVGVEATYDKVAVIPGRRLWDQVATNITDGPIDGWGYLITPNSLASEACREELAYALDRALHTKDRSFPLIGLLHGVKIQDVPPALRVRLSVNLSDPNWKEAVRSGLEGHAASTSAPVQSQYVWKVHSGYSGDASSVAVEVHPRFGDIMYWRFAVPHSASVARWGYGPSGGGPISGMRTFSVEGGAGEINGQSVVWFGAGDRLSPSISAYVVFKGVVPESIYFGLAKEPFGGPVTVEMFRLK